MRRSTLHFAVFLFALATLAAACTSAGAESQQVTSSTTTTTTTAPPTTTTTTAPPTTTTTTTTAPAPVVAADTINGVPSSDAEAKGRRVIAVKIDNHPHARPQTGVQEADAVYELLVEGGLTRFIALFHAADSEPVGPVRSGRPTDGTLIRPMDSPFQVSGAQAWVQRVLSDVNVIYDNGTTTYRDDRRERPNNLYSTTDSIRQYADERGWSDDPPAPLFGFTEPGAIEGEAATLITLNWSDHPLVRWRWTGEKYLRFNASEPHLWVTADGAIGQVSADTIVIMMARRYTASPNGQGTPVPALETVGSGEAMIIHDGEYVTGTWTRESDLEPFLLLDEGGDEIQVPAGKLWMAIFPDNRPVTIEG